MKHTRGPWEKDGLAIVGQSPELEICVCTADDDIPEETADANALLIAASPELLEWAKALLYSVDVHLDYCDDDDMQKRADMLRGVIQKAEGRE